MPRRNILLFTCILFCYLFHAGHGVEAGIYKRSISQEDAAFIESLAEQLYNAETRSIGRERTDDDEDKKSFLTMEVRLREEGDLDDRGAQGDELGTELIRAVDIPANTKVTAKEEEIAPAGLDPVKRSSTPPPKAHEGVPLVAAGSGDAKDEDSTMYLIILITVCCLAGVVALIFATVCFYSHQNQKEKTKQIPYASTPIYTYETVQSTKSYSGTEYSPALLPTDNALAISAQKWNFQHSKQKILDMENENKEMEPASHLSVDCTDEVYETPGFAPMWDVEVDCPLYNEDATPGTTPRDNTPMMRNHSPDANRRNSGDEGANGNNIRHLNGDASNAAHLTNGPKSMLHGEAENETFLVDSNDRASQSRAAISNNSNENNVNSNVTDVNSNDINRINGVNGFHE